MLAASFTHSHERHGNANDQVFIGFMQRLQARFAERVGDGVPLFTTDAGDLWGSYLAAFPPSTRQSHNCNACHHFIRRYGGLVTIGEHGESAPAFWNEDDAPEEYREAISALRWRVRRAKVTGVFLSGDAAFGADIDSDTWVHYLLAPRPVNRFSSKTQSPYQAMAEKREDYKNVQLALSEVSAHTIATAVELLKSDALYRSEKVLGAAEWLLRLALVRRYTRHAFANALWLAVANAPAGFCHPRSSMIGTLLEDIDAGLPFADVSRKFKAKMSPLVYQRPTAAPTAGAIQQAERVVEQLGIARSLERRFARLEDVQALWRPKPLETPIGAGGVFGHLQPKAETVASRLIVPPQVITWTKFARTVLPDAKRMELMVPNHGAFAALVTAANADAPPILQWDTEEQRNPVSWYMYVSGSPASRWRLTGGTWTNVSAITLQPSMWFGDKYPHQGKAAVFLIQGARDEQSQSLALFPEILKSELHGVRSVIEAHSRSGKLSGVEASTACGLVFSEKAPVHVRVAGSTGVAVEYKIDRWE